MKWKIFSVAKSLNSKDEHWLADYSCTTWKWEEIVDFDALWTCGHKHVSHISILEFQCLSRDVYVSYK